MSTLQVSSARSHRAVALSISPARSGSPPLLPFAIPLLCLLLLFPLPSNGDYLCPISPSCGELKDIPYPFWIYNETFPSYSCGYPGFKLVCHNNTPMLHLGFDDYKVFGIDDASRKISLADADVLLSMPPECPRVRHNLTFLPTYEYEYLAQYFDLLLEYASSDVNLTFFFNCTDGPPSLSSHEITCLPDVDGNKSYVFTDDTIPHELYHNCVDIVVAPVLLENMDRPGIVDTYGGTLRSGFELNWSLLSHGSCGECERSKGRCGMNQTSNSAWVFSCFCSNGIIEENKCGVLMEESCIGESLVNVLFMPQYGLVKDQRVGNGRQQSRRGKGRKKGEEVQIRAVL